MDMTEWLNWIERTNAWWALTRNSSPFTKKCILLYLFPLYLLDEETASVRLKVLTWGIFGHKSSLSDPLFLWLLQTWQCLLSQMNGRCIHVYFIFLCSSNNFNHLSMKRRKDRTLRDELSRSGGVQYVIVQQWKITPERMKRWSQSKNNTPLWMWLVMQVNSNAVKNNIA